MKAEGLAGKSIFSNPSAKQAYPFFY